MGRNFYLCPSSDGKESFENVDFEYQEGVYHIGKSSGGWIFSFDLAFFQIWEEKKDNRWKFAKVYWDRRLLGERCYRPCPPEPVYTITEDDVWEVLETPGYMIVDENGCVHTLKELKELVQSKATWPRTDGKEPWTSYTYQMCMLSDARLGQYRKHFVIGSLEFTPYTNFS